ncbi:peptide ABC transporter substrate-binding protein [Vulcanimicrobium alpinum]|uniref:ABC transporter substrate-binding protein n=1 Tax=Vulcanimicrobium alpinum TaxID=3016050 RepID=UPI00295F33A9|nr:peptide ABC transporter substrate-binding protein [Vulcanimicrobium alpinum]
MTAVVLLATQAGAAEPARHNSTTVPHTLRIGDTLDFDSLNPHLATALTLGYLSQLTMAYLVRYGHDNKPIPELATSVPTQANGGISRDGKTITWHLRRGVKWSDGVPFDADDVVFSTSVVNNPANNEVGRDGWDQIVKVDEPDKYTVVYHLNRPYASYLPTFFGSAGANPCILPKHLLSNLPNINTAPYNSKPVGIGPFRYAEWVRGDHVTLERNPFYWRGQPKLEKVIFKIIPDRNTLQTQLQTGEVDLWAFVPSAYVERVTAFPNVAHTRAPGFLYVHVDFNTSHAVLRDLAVREALRYATDRKLLRDKQNHGVGILQESPLTPVSPLYSPIPEVPHDVAKANALLDRAGWKRGPDGIRAKNGTRLELDYGSVAGSQDIDARIELLRSMWSQIGVALNVKHYASPQFFQVTGGILYGGKWDVTSFSWQVTPDSDLNPQNACGTIPPKGQNVTRLCDRQLDASLTALKETYDEKQRKALVARITRRVSELVPYFVLWIFEDVHVFNRDLAGFHPNATTPFDDFMNVDI